MNYNSMNEHQKRAFKLMIDNYNDIIGGLENTLMDNSRDSEEYKKAKNYLSNPQFLIDDIYSQTIQQANRMGFAKHIRFAGTDWLKYRIAKRLNKEGYYKSFETKEEFEH